MASYLRRVCIALLRRNYGKKILPESNQLLWFSTSVGRLTNTNTQNDYLDAFHISKLMSPTSRGCSSKPDSSNGEGPVAKDFSSILPEEEFHKLADDILHSLQEKLEEHEEDIQIDGFDMDYASGVLTVKLGNLGTYVINKQTPNRQIWLSSPVSGPARFDWDSENQAWIYRRTKANLLRLLENEWSSLLNTSITLAS